MKPNKDDILAAAERIAPFIHHTPVLQSRLINEIVGANLFFKCENFQRTGAFKMRGATNAILSLKDKAFQNGVATHSSGNHAAALSLAAKDLGIKAFIVMPDNSSKVKIEAVKQYGGQITFCEPTVKGREEMLATVISSTNAIEIHPYNNKYIIAGQATAAKELFDEVKSLEYIIAPVGGGGLLSGTALSTYYFSPTTTVIAAEPANADDAYRSFISGKIEPTNPKQTIADGLRTSLGTITFTIIIGHVSEILTVSEESIIEAMRLIWMRMKIIVEPSSAVPLAAILANKEKFRNKKIGIIISGGNVDIDDLPW
ncbi:MAG: pyridoxal-phosphate dependent enzyme [Bacteroidetes bacterium]|nr:pyridoxal-phosphate dependent enzyme [Bacteroidota bacterium]